MTRSYVFFIKVLFGLWALGTLLFIWVQPNSKSTVDIIKTTKSKDLHQQIDKLEGQLKEQSNFYDSLLDKLRSLEKHKDAVKRSREEEEESEIIVNERLGASLTEGPILPILILACNREPAIKRSLNLLIKYRPSRQRFPIIVSQDCGHQLTKKSILEYGNQVTLIEQPDLSIIEVPLKEKKFRGYFMIARHYKWALNQIFNKFNYEAVIIVEDDLDIAPDFFEYFSATYPILKMDPTLWCVSAWNDNGKNGLIDTKNGASTLYRTDFFPGLGWMFTKDTWGELESKWPRSYWDDWMRAPNQRQDRACITPEVSRTRTFGKKGVSNGLFFEKHLKFIHLNSEYVEFTKLDLTYLLKESYEDEFEKAVQKSQVVSLQEVKSGRLPEGSSYRILYHTKEVFKKITKALGLMDDFKAGVPRTGYKGVVTMFYSGKRIYLAPNNSWRGYDPTWS